MKSKAEEPSGIDAEMMKAAGETGIEIITDWTNQITAVILKDWELSTS